MWRRLKEETYAEFGIKINRKPPEEKCSKK
jgi:hypothetical protein